MAALVNSGSRRDQPRPESLQSKKIGCMSGLFHLLHSSSRKRITSARREAAEAKTAAEYANASTRKHKLPKTTTSRHKSQATLQGGQARTIRLPGNIDGRDITPPIPRLQQHHISCNAPRSPTLAPELRRSNSVDSPCRQEAAQSCLHRSPVAKLMGLDDMHTTDPTAAAAAASPVEKEAAAEKRRKLLGALEKCDEDLQALKKIIEAIKKAEISSSHATGNGMDDAALISSTNCKSRSCHSEAEEQDDKDARHNLMDVEASGGQQTIRLDCNGRSTTSEPGKCMGEMKKQWEDQGTIAITTYGGYDQQPSPVSVLDGSTLLFSPSQVLLLTPPLKVGDHYKRHSKKVGKDNSFLERINIVVQAPSALLGAPRRRGEPLVAACRRPVRPSGSKALRETVSEVWMEGVWGQGWELGRVSVVVERDIFGELVAEFVKELNSCCTLVTRIKRYKPPFEVCRKRLSF